MSAWTARSILARRGIVTLCELERMSDPEVVIFYDYVMGVRPRNRKNQIG